MIFVSYKREDAPRVAPLVAALEAHDLEVWWDADLAAARSWRVQISDALAEAKAVVVVWTERSTGPTGDFVWDEASRAKARGVLVPVRFDPLEPPPGFGEVQTIDLSGWRGAPRDLDLLDLVAALRALEAGEPPPPRKAPRTRLLRRGFAGGTLLAAVPVLLRLFDAGCAWSGLPVGLADTCGAVGLGDQPTRADRLVYQALPPGDCDALRAYSTAHPDPLRRRALDRVAAARLVPVTHPEEHRLPLFTRGPDAPDPATARAALATAAQREADRLCHGFAATATFDLTGAIAVGEPSCESIGPSTSCALDGEAVCALLATVRTEACD